MATEDSGGGTADLFYVLEVLGYVSIYGCRKYIGGASGAPQGREARPRGGRPHPREHLVPSFMGGPRPSGVFPSKNNFSS